MPRALEIPVEVTRLDRALDSIRRTSSTVRGVGDASESSAQRLQQSWTRAMERISRDQERYLRVSGPAQRLQRAVQAREAAVASGDEARIFDAQAAVARATVGMQRARRQMAMAGQGAFMQRLTGMIASTRFSAGPVAPLVGRTAELLGIPMTGGAGLAVAGAAAAVGAFTLAIKTATENLNQLGDAMRLGGGGPADVAGAARFGFRGAEGANAAEAFRQRIATDPMAMMFASRLGIRALPEPFGTVNNIGLMRQASEQLAKITDAEERLRTARVLGLESALRYIDVSPRVNQLLDAQAKLEEQIAAGGGAKAANDLSVELEVLHQSFSDLAALTLPPVIEGLNDLIASLLRLQNQSREDPFGAAGRQLSAQLNPFDPNFWSRMNPFSSQFWTGIPDSGDAQQANTKAVQDNTQAHKDTQKKLDGFLQPGVYGGGPNTQAAIPSGWSGDFLARNMEAQSLGRGVPPGSSGN